MRILCIHADHFKYEVRNKTKFAEEIGEDEGEVSLQEALVVFASVEKDDEGALEQVARKAKEEISSIAQEVKAPRIVLYPYAHLSSELAHPDRAKELTRSLEGLLGEAGHEVHRSPFGWYKAFEISCKGHPMSELSREVRVGPGEDGGAKTREEAVSAITSRFLILTQEGEEVDFDPEDPSTLPVLDRFPALRTFVEAEEIGRGDSREPPSIKAMQRLELVDYEEATDSGHFRLYPKGTIIFNLLRDWAQKIAIERLGCVEIETPILYDWDREDIRGQAMSFHERHYTIETPEKRKFVLRFAGDFGLFRMFGDATLSYRHLPIKVYEFSKSFRFEKRGELTGLKRLRAFHMPDIHAFARDIPQGWEEFGDIYRAYADFSDGTDVEYCVAFRIEREFYDNYKDELVKLLKYSDRPALIEVLSGRKHYWAVKMEFNGLDSVGGACQLSTDQLDVEDAERYGIMFTTEEGGKEGCIIAHSSIGSLERWIYQLLEHALKMEKPVLPLWLAPVQVRLIPVTSDFVEDCQEIARSLDARADVDDRDLKLGKRIRDAEREWINMIVVYGEKEAGSGKLAVRLRTGDKKGEQRKLTVGEINRLISEETGGYPRRPLSLPMRVSRRPIFRG